MKNTLFSHAPFCIAIFLILLLPTLTVAQQHIVGRVFNGKGEPIAGAFISGLDTDISTTTWRDGRFRLSGQKINTIQCTMPGYALAEKPAITEKEVIIVLRPDAGNTPVARSRNAQVRNAQAASPLTTNLEPRGNAINFTPIATGVVKPADFMKRPPILVINPGKVELAVKTTSLSQQATNATWIVFPTYHHVAGMQIQAGEQQIPINFQDPRRFGGFVLATKAVTEDGSNRDILQMQSTGNIRGFFPAMTLPQNPRFKASIGFLKDATSNNTRFSVMISSESKTETILNTQKSYNGKLQDIDIELTRFAGQKVTFELRIENGAGIWVNPRIEGN